MPLLLAGCFWKSNPGPAPLALAEAPVNATLVPAQGPDVRSMVAIRAGSAYDPAGREGLAWLTAHLVVEGGTTSLTPAQVASSLEGWGGHIEVEVGRERVLFAIRSPPAHAREAADLLGALISEPGLDPAALDRLRAEGQRRLDEIAAGPPGPLAEVLLFSWLYEAHPYGHEPQGRSTSLAAMGALDVSQFLARRYVRSVVAAGVSGPADAPEVAAARDALNARLSELAPLLSPPPTPRLVPTRDARALVVVEHPGEGAALALGVGVNAGLGSADGQALALAAAALDGRLRAHLHGAASTMAELYSARDVVQGAVIVRVVPTDPAGSADLLDETLHELTLFAQDGLETAELGEVRDPDPLEAAVVGPLMRWWRPATTPAEPLPLAVINAAIGRYFVADHLSMVAVTPDAEGLRDALTEYAAPSDVQRAGEGGAETTAPSPRLEAGLDRISIIQSTEIFR